MAACDGRAGQVKDEHSNIESEPAVHTMKIQASADPAIIAEAVEAKTDMPQANMPMTEMASACINVPEPEIVMPTEQETAVKDATNLNSSEAIQQPTDFQTHQHTTAPLTVLSAAAALNRFDTFAEEDDYDVDD